VDLDLCSHRPQSDRMGLPEKRMRHPVTIDLEEKLKALRGGRLHTPNGPKRTEFVIWA
jgi:hypothetical protein